MKCEKKRKKSTSSTCGGASYFFPSYANVCIVPRNTAAVFEHYQGIATAKIVSVHGVRALVVYLPLPMDENLRTKLVAHFYIFKLFYQRARPLN